MKCWFKLYWLSLVQSEHKLRPLLYPSTAEPYMSHDYIFGMDIRTILCSAFYTNRNIAKASLGRYIFNLGLCATATATATASNE